VNGLKDVNATSPALDFQHVGSELAGVEIFRAPRTNPTNMSILDLRIPFAVSPCTLFGWTIGLSGAGAPAWVANTLPLAPVAVHVTQGILGILTVFIFGPFPAFACFS